MSDEENGTDFDIDNYSISELMEILGLKAPASKAGIISASGRFIEKYKKLKKKEFLSMTDYPNQS